MIDKQLPNEKLLVTRCLNGDRLAWDEFFATHYRTIASVVACRRWCFSRTEADDVIQDCLEAVVRSLGQFEFRSKVGTFVHKIAVSTCIAHLRKKTAQKRGGGFAELPIDSFAERMDIQEKSLNSAGFGNPEAMLVRRETIQRVGKALARLNERCRELVRARYFNELSFQEISQQTGIKENSLVVQLKRCLVELCKVLQAQGSHV